MGQTRADAVWRRSLAASGGARAGRRPPAGPKTDRGGFPLCRFGVLGADHAIGRVSEQEFHRNMTRSAERAQKPNFSTREGRCARAERSQPQTTGWGPRVRQPRRAPARASRARSPTRTGGPRGSRPVAPRLERVVWWPTGRPPLRRGRGGAGARNGPGRRKRPLPKRLPEAWCRSRASPGRWR